MIENPNQVVKDAQRIIAVIRKHLENDEEGKSNLSEIVKEALSDD